MSSLRTLQLVLLFALFGMFLAPQSALAEGQSYDEDDEDDEDEPDEDEDEDEPDEADDELEDLDRNDRSRRVRNQRRKRKRPTREVVKGAYAKINIGPVIWLPPISDFTSTTGTEMDFSFGYDIVDLLGFTLTAELSLFQVVTNGEGVSVELPFASPIQGDFRVVGGVVSVRPAINFGGKRVKRISLGLNLGGGAGFSPDLIDLENNPNALSRVAAGYGTVMQQGVLGIVAVGPGIEYYTKLAHFSIGLDVDFDLIIGGPVPAMGLAFNLFVKYTF